LQVKEKIFREAIETMPAIAWIAGPDGTIQFRNQRWVEYTNLSQVPNPQKLCGFTHNVKLSIAMHQQLAVKQTALDETE
jgi:PAS domain-containing protein